MANIEALRHYLVKQAGHGCTEAGALLEMVREWEWEKNDPKCWLCEATHEDDIGGEDEVVICFTEQEMKNHRDESGYTVEPLYTIPPAAPAVPDGCVAVPAEIINRFPEINPSNYGHDDVCNLNAWAVELVLAAAPKPDHFPDATKKVGNRIAYPTGYTSCYIYDYLEFSHLRDISAQEAVTCVSLCCPEVSMGHHTKAKDLTIGTGDDTDALGNGWLNKLFIVIGAPDGNPVAIYNHDGKFSAYQAVTAEGGAA